MAQNGHKMNRTKEKCRIKRQAPVSWIPMPLIAWPLNCIYLIQKTETVFWDIIHKCFIKRRGGHTVSITVMCPHSWTRRWCGLDSQYQNCGPQEWRFPKAKPPRSKKSGHRDRTSRPDWPLHLSSDSTCQVTVRQPGGLSGAAMSRNYSM